MKTSKIALLAGVILFFSNQLEAQKVQVWLTKGDQSKKFEKQKEEYFFEKKDSDIPTISVDDSRRFQTMDGFGFSLTGGSAMLLNQMTNKSEVLKELFGTQDNAIGISYLRISIGASDLDSAVFSYSEKKGHFSLAEDEKNLIPVLKEILKINPKLKILGSPWSPPIWMKTNNNSIGGSLKKENYQDYADYLVRYLGSMKKKGITIDAITVQNEPLHPGNNPSLLMLGSEQAEFVKNNLGPALVKSGLKTKIIIYDHNADRPDYPIRVLSDPAARKYIDGSAFHMYGGNVETLTDVHEAFPDKGLYFTEQWIGHPTNFQGDLTWHIKNLVIGASKNWCKTVLEWNLAADPYQKPHTPGGCTACLGAITIDGNNFSKNTAYYIIAHASKFVRPGSIRIASNTTMSLPNVAFKTSDGKTVLIVLNESDKEIDLSISSKGNRIFQKLDAFTVATYVW
ncbi:MAG: glucosylceramidase [Cytophagaceae bacterium]|nr:glucosylceramidase [Cytophagaceae bacterium]